MAKSINKFKDPPLDVKVVSFRKSNLNLVKMINEIQNEILSLINKASCSTSYQALKPITPVQICSANS